MAVNTTSLAAIVANYTTVLEALAPTRHADKPFCRIPRAHTLDAWVANNAGSASFRKFEFLETGADEDPGLLDPVASLRRREVSLTIAYPPGPLGLYGRDGYVDLEAIAEEDAAKVRDALFSSGNYLAGQLSGFVTALPLDRNDGVWMKRFTVVIDHYASQTLT